MVSKKGLEFLKIAADYIHQINGFHAVVQKVYYRKFVVSSGNIDLRRPPLLTQYNTTMYMI